MRREGLPFEALSPTLMPCYFMSHIPVMIQLYQSNSHSREIDWKDALLWHASLARCPFPNRDIRDSSHGLSYLQLRFLSIFAIFLDNLKAINHGFCLFDNAGEFKVYFEEDANLKRILAGCNPRDLESRLGSG
jgi:hypothetical protein